MPNFLMGEAALKFGPIVLETLIKHYFERIKHNTEEGKGKGMTQLRQDEILYDQAFTVVKVRVRFLLWSPVSNSMEGVS
jgi:hypothetical protein